MFLKELSYYYTLNERKFRKISSFEGNIFFLNGLSSIAMLPLHAQYLWRVTCTFRKQGTKRHDVIYYYYTRNKKNLRFIYLPVSSSISLSMAKDRQVKSFSNTSRDTEKKKNSKIIFLVDQWESFNSKENKFDEGRFTNAGGFLKKNPVYKFRGTLGD